MQGLNNPIGIKSIEPNQSPFITNPYRFAAAGVGGWVELGRTTLGSTGDTISVSSLPDKRYYMILHNHVSTGYTNKKLRFNSDSGSNYARRYSYNGGTDNSTKINQNMLYVGSTGTKQEFGVGYVANKSDKEKLLIWHYLGDSSIGANYVPIRNETVGKWANTSDVISSVNLINDSSGDYGTDDEIVVLGWDESDTHTDNFWEELASVDTGAGAVLDSGTFTAKKYLWFQFDAVVDTYNNTNATIRFNSDTGSNYNRRLSQNGGTDNTAVNQSNMTFTYSGGKRVFGNYFVINNSANEKLAIGHTNAIGTTSNSTSEGAGTAPRRVEVVGKWANTSSQITQIEVLDTAQGDLGLTSGTIKVWGSD